MPSTWRRYFRKKELQTFYGPSEKRKFTKLDLCQNILYFIIADILAKNRMVHINLWYIFILEYTGTYLPSKDHKKYHWYPFTFQGSKKKLRLRTSLKFLLSYLVIWLFGLVPAECLL